MRVFAFLAFIYMIYLFVRSVKCVHSYLARNFCNILCFALSLWLAMVSVGLIINILRWST